MKQLTPRIIAVIITGGLVSIAALLEWWRNGRKASRYE